MRPVDPEALAMVAEQLDRLGTAYAFTGGAVVGFLLDNPQVAILRPTDDVDAIAAVVSHVAYTKVEEKLRELEFRHDTSEGAPPCRFLYQGTKVDVMPSRDTTGRFSDQWFDYAVATAQKRTWGSLTIRTVSPACFIATKLTAFANRGKGDWYSHDLEDIITVVDGRKSLVEDITAEEPTMRIFIAGRIRGLLEQEGFRDALPGHLGGTDVTHGRLPGLLKRLEAIAALGESAP